MQVCSYCDEEIKKVYCDINNDVYCERCYKRLCKKCNRLMYRCWICIINLFA